MNPARRRQIENLYHAVLAHEPKNRGKFLADACEGDSELRSELESLLADAKTTEAVLEKPAIELAAPLLVDDQALHETVAVRANSRPPWWMYLIAASFLAKAVFMTAFCFSGPEPTGIEVRSAKAHPVVIKVGQDSPAERAEVQQGDALLRANDRSIVDSDWWYWFLGNLQIGQPIVLDIDRGGRHLRTALVLRSRPSHYWFTGQGLVLLINLGGQFLALAVAFFIAFMRPRDPLARMGALFLAVYSTAVLTSVEGISAMWRQWPFWYQVLLWAASVLSGLGLGVWFTFFALFPRPSFHSRWVWPVVWAPIILVSLLLDYQTWHFIYSSEKMIPWNWMSVLFAACWIIYLPGSFAMLAVKYRRLKDETEKRRVRLIVFSLAFVVVLAVPVLVYSQHSYSGSPAASLFESVPVRALATLAGAAFPLCFAYAILRHRLFDIRVIIRQGIRYAAAKQLLLLGAPAIIAVFLADLYAHRDQRVDTIAQDRGWIYLGLAGVAVLAHIRRQHWLQSLDRHFFREHYNAREILRTTLERVGAASSLAEVAPIVVKQIEAAMHPIFCAIFEHRPREPNYELVSVYPDGVSRPPLRSDSKAVELAKVMGKPVQLTSEHSWLARQLPSSETEYLERSGVDLIAPVKGHRSDALIVMGRKRSEEPYTSEDMRLLEDVSIGLALLPSRRFSEERFRLESRIGQGGMGAVYEATDLQLERKVALKLISENLIADSAALDRFQREARILAGFQHPNVVTLFDVGVMPDGGPFLVMERLQGRTLRDELNCGTRLSSDEIHSIVRQLCAGLSAAHRRFLIHRDLKPENIFLCEGGVQPLVKILDFGLAKLFLGTSASAQTGTFSTVTAQIAGTPAYMSPELLLGAKPDRSCDMWALAVITHELLTGRRPVFARDGLLENPAEALPECWRDFFNSSLAHQPSQRPESVDVFLERFERCAASV